jgi:hypothetical protein
VAECKGPVQVPVPPKRKPNTFMIKTLKKLGIEENFLNVGMCVHKNPQLI